ncbi:MAG: hypothetical protein ACT4OK_14555 [Gemmobacter sp.]
MGRMAAMMMAGAVLAAPAMAQDVGGTYVVQGTGFNGQAYAGEAQINVTSDVTCEIKWNTGGQLSEGICMRSGNVFAAAYVLGGKAGMIIYTINPDRSMQGQWTIAGMDGVGTETLYPQ